MSLLSLRNQIGKMEERRKLSVYPREKRRLTSRLISMKNKCKDIQENSFMNKFKDFIDMFRYMGLDVMWRRERNTLVFSYKNQISRVHIHDDTYKVTHYVQDVIVSSYKTTKMEHVCINIHSVSLFRSILDDLN